VKDTTRTALAMIAAQLLIQPYGHKEEKPVEDIPKPVRHPWDYVQLSKAERAGKTYEEIQELRKAKYMKEKQNETNT